MADPLADPEIAIFNDRLNEEWKRHPSILDVSPEEARKIVEDIRRPWRLGGPDMATTSEHLIGLPSGQLRIRLYYPRGLPTPAPALIYLHGGGFVLFSIDTHDRLMREYAAAGGFAVIGVDYPLAPEHKFPAALNRIADFVVWLEANAHAFAIDSSKLFIGGDSAGSNLSFASCLRLRDRKKLHLIKGILSNYGGFSPECTVDAEADHGGAEAILNKSEADYYWQQYLPSPDDRENPYASPIFADLRGLPPVMLVIADHDILSFHGHDMAHRLDAAGVRHEVRVYRGATHSFLEAMSVSSLARQAILDGADFICREVRTLPG